MRRLPTVGPEVLIMNTARVLSKISVEHVESRIVQLRRDITSEDCLLITSISTLRDI